MYTLRRGACMADLACIRVIVISRARTAIRLLTNCKTVSYLTNIMATEPETAAGQRPVEALAAKLKRRYACLQPLS